MRKISAKIALSAFILSSAMGPALGADLDAEILQQQAVTPVEFGSGWYLRGDISWEFNTDGNLTYYTTARNDYDNQSFDAGAGYSVGVGYIFNDWFRTDVTLDYGGKKGWDGTTAITGCGGAYTGDCFTADGANYERYSLHANAYVSLANWGGFSPYVGAGVGLTHLSWNNYAAVATCAIDAGETCPYGTYSGSGGTEYYSGATTTYPSADCTVLSYSLMAGVDYRVDDHWKVDFAYKWTRLHGGTVVNANINGPGSPAGDSKVDWMGVQEFRVGLRYEIW